MRSLRIFTLSLRYFRLHYRRYIFLLIALSFGFAVITILTSLRAGMEENVYLSAQSHYAGDIVVLGEDKSIKTKNQIVDPERIVDLIKNSNIRFNRIVQRTNVGSGILYYNGMSLKQKYVLGVDWENEENYFDNLEYKGQPENLKDSGGILISSPIANQLSIRQGDKVTLEVKTKNGQVNTGSFIVNGIIEDKSIFGYYKCYLSRQDLNSLILYGEKDCSSIGVYLSDGEHIEHSASKIHTFLKNNGESSVLPKDRDDLNLEKKKEWNGLRYFIITLPVYLSEVTDLLNAIEVISYFLYVMMLLIIIVSVMVTYRLILHDRERELGTMQAIAFSAEEIIVMLMFEAFVLFLISIVTGLLLSKVIIWGVSFLSFSRIQSFEIFMNNGKLTAVYSIRTILINSIIVFTALLPAVIIPVYNSVKQPLAAVLNGGNK